MQTAKAMGYKKGDFVFTGAFPGIIISDVHTATPCCEVWGFEHESGSCYAKDLRKLTLAEFNAMLLQHGYAKADPFSTEAKRSLSVAYAEVTGS